MEARDFLFFLFTGSESNVRHGRSRPQTLQTLPQPFRRPQTLPTLPQPNVRHRRSRPPTLQTLPQARLVCRLFPGKKSRRYLSFSFLFSRRPKTIFLEARDFLFFLFTGSESNVRHGRSRPQTLQTPPQPFRRRQTLAPGLKPFKPCRSPTLGTAGPGPQPYKRSRRPG